jgi:hypothetical protein
MLLTIPTRAIQWFERYERHLSSGAMLFGFVLDNLTLTRVDLLFDNLVIIFYLCVATLSIALVHFHASRRWEHEWLTLLRTFAPVPMQFAFGGLFSSFAVFYSRSASLASSWIFVLMLFTLLIGNEFFRERYARLTFQIGVLFYAIYSYAIIFVPIVVGRMGAGVFLLSGLVSVVIVLTLIGLFAYVSRERVMRHARNMSVAIGGIVVLMNTLYFTNIIPPIPLSLKDAGVYHAVWKSTDGTYHVLDEERDWKDRIWPIRTIHLAPQERAYAYSSVFAPTRITTRITHEWEFFNESTNDWEVQFTYSFGIVGGRDGGYRGYTEKMQVPIGKWRVNVRTPDGLLLGRLRFNVARVATAPNLVEVTK